MSGECDMCGEHTLDCECNKESVTCSPTELRDKCNNINHLLTCLLIILQGDEYRAYNGSPHLTLILDIHEKVKEIEEKLRNI